MHLTGLSLFLFFKVVISFYPNRLADKDIGDNTLTHKDITEIGILRAVAAYFEDNPRNDSTIRTGDLTQMKDINARKLFKEYYGDEVSERRLEETIGDIVLANNEVNLKYLKQARWHCNGEAIKEANELMIRLREQAIGVLKQENANLDLARELIGQFLHIVQMFYSNTNWVELSGPIAYYSLGIRGKPLYGQALLAVDTCKSCGATLDKSCENTLLIKDDVLTSGYKSGQDAKKPFKDPRQIDVGKCSHGGPDDDTSGTIAAVGGINKDSTRFTLSPRHDLHQWAAEAAINHTTFFFNDKDYGIRFLIGEDRYEQLLQLKSGVSLVFTIDYTGSMGDDIEAVKAVVLDITSSVIGTINEPDNYIISLFNDPASRNRVHQTGDGEEALQILRDIVVSGGQDCPETAMDGLGKALALCNPNSIIYFFSDASANDPGKGSSVLSQALLKNVKLEFLLTGDCGSKRRSTDGSLHRQKRSTNGEDLYRSLAAATGGSVYVTDKDGIANVSEIIKESVTTSSVSLIKQTVPVSSDFSLTIPVDTSIRQATIKIITTNGLPSDHQLFMPDGSAATTNVDVRDLGSGIKVIKMETPVAGPWRLLRQDSNPWDVEVTAQSTLDFTAVFVDKDPVTGFEYEISGRPVAGEDATLVISTSAPEIIDSVNSVLLLNSTGGELARYTTLTRVATRTGLLTYKSTFPLPEEGFYVAVTAADKAGNTVLRLQPRRILPVSIELRTLPVNGNLYINENVSIPFVVVNKGDAESVVTVSAIDDQDFVVAPTSFTFTLQSSQNATGEFHLRAGSEIGVTTTVTISASTAAASSDDFQYEIIRLSTEERIVREVDNMAPTCNITSVTGQCDATMLDPCTCSQYKWSGAAEIGDDGFGLYRISASIKGAESFEHDSFSQGHSLENGTIAASVKSDCCNALVYITVVDLASNTGQCVFDLAPGLEKPLEGCKRKGETGFFDSVENRIIVGVVVAVTVGLIITVVATVYIMRKKKKTKSRK